MARQWLAIRVELVGGRGEELDPRPGRLFVAAPTHTFEQLGEAISTAFARWDLGHLSEFSLEDGTLIGNADPELDPPEEMVEAAATKLSRLGAGERFSFVFDLGDYWEHTCTVLAEPVDPLEVLGIAPKVPMPFFGWGTIPDQYGRETDDSES